MHMVVVVCAAAGQVHAHLGSTWARQGLHAVDTLLTLRGKQLHVCWAANKQRLRRFLLTRIGYPSFCIVEPKSVGVWHLL